MATVDRNEILLTARDATRAAFESAKRNLGDLTKSTAALSASMRLLGTTAAVVALGKFTGDGVAAVAALDDLAESSTLSVEALSQLRQLALGTGHDLNQVAGTAGKFAKSVGDASAGNKDLLAAFEDLGLSIDDLRGKKFDELFTTFAKNIAGAEDRQRALAVASKLAGKAVAEQVPFFKDLAEYGLKAANVTAEQAAAAERLQNELRALRVEFDRVQISLANALVPTLNDVSTAMRDTIKLGLTLSESFGALIGINPFRSATEQLKDVNKELQTVGKLAEGFQKGSILGTVYGVRESILLNQRQVLLSLQRSQALRLAGPGSMDARDLRLQNEQRGFQVGTKSGGDDDAAGKARLALAEARAKAIADSERKLAEVRLDLLDRFYGDGLIAEQDYWSRRIEVQQAAGAASVKAAQEEVRQRQAALAQTTKGSSDYLNALKELEDAQRRVTTAQQEAATATVKSWLDSQKAAKAYQDTLGDLQADLDELQGKTAAATAARFDRQNETQRQRFATNGDARGQALLDNLRAARVAQAEFNDARDAGEVATARLAIAEERIQNNRRLGAASELEALRQTSAARAAALEQLEATARALEAAASASGLPRLGLQAEQFRAEVERLRAEVDLVGQRIEQVFTSAGSDAFADFISGAKSGKEAVRDLVNSVTQQLSRLAAEDVFAKLFSGAKAGKDAGGLGGVVGDGLEFIKGLFRDSGGRGAPGQPVLIGRGAQPEVFVPDSAGTFYPRGQYAMRGAGGGQVLNLTVNAPPGMDRRSAQQFAYDVGRQVAHATRRNG